MTEEKQTTAIATLPDGTLATYDYGEFAGMGKEDTRQDELAIPFLNLLQGLSPEVTEGNAKFNPDARPGMFCKSTTGELIPGKEGFAFLPVLRDPCYVQWRPDRGGFVARHDRDSDVVKQAKLAADNDEANLRVTRVEVDEETGKRTEVEDVLDRTVYLYGLILEQREGGGWEALSLVVISFTGTKLKQYRRWYSAINESKRTKNAPLFANLVKIVAVQEQNRKGQTFYNFKLDPLNGGAAASLISPNDEDGRTLMREAADFVAKIKGGEIEADLGNPSGKEEKPTGAASDAGVPADEAFAD